MVIPSVTSYTFCYPKIGVCLLVDVKRGSQTKAQEDLLFLAASKENIEDLSQSSVYSTARIGEF